MLRIAERRWPVRHAWSGDGSRRTDHWIPGDPIRPLLRTLGAAIALAALLALAVLLALSLPDGAHADTIYYTYTLQWTAPGDDGTIGRAKAYELRYSLNPITESNWASAMYFPGLPLPSAPGTKESFTIYGLDGRNNYYVALKTVDDAGNWSQLSNVVFIHTPVPVGTPEDSSRIALMMPWPNPANGEMRFAYQLARPGPVVIDALDIAGRRMKRLTSGIQGAGRGVVTWDLRNDRGLRVSPGVYLIRAQLLDQVVTRRLVVER